MFILIIAVVKCNSRLRRLPPVLAVQMLKYPKLIKALHRTSRTMAKLIKKLNAIRTILQHERKQDKRTDARVFLLMG